MKMVTYPRTPSSEQLTDVLAMVAAVPGVPLYKGLVRRLSHFTVTRGIE